ncbi:hypothetical protein ACFLXI_07095 [Chloroflexota bacterium]
MAKKKESAELTVRNIRRNTQKILLPDCLTAKRTRPLQESIAGVQGDLS